MSNKLKYDVKELGFVPPQYGGVSVSTGRLIDKLTEDGFKAGGFYTNENKDEKLLRSELFELELYLSVKHIFTELPRGIRLLKPYRLLHSHYSLEHMIYMWCFLHILHKKMVITVHNSMVSRFYKECDFINRFFMKRVAKHPDVTWIAVSEQARKEMLSLPITFTNPIYVIPAYIPDTKQHSEALPKPMSDYIKKHKKNIVFYGHDFMVHNGVEVYGFIDALKLYAKLIQQQQESIGFVLCISNGHNSERIGELKETAQMLGIEDKIYWQLSALKNMNALWNNTDVYIRPTCTDGDSLAVREALDLGVQVVASDVCKRPERTITYEYNNMEDFIKKVDLALQKGHSKSEPDFENYNKIKAIYNQLLKG